MIMPLPPLVQRLHARVHRLLLLLVEGIKEKRRTG
jgi:hypothetical protein